MNTDKRVKVFFSTLIILFFILIPSLGGESYYFEKRDLSSLIIPSVTCITQDDRGYIWVGTPGGLLRYDSRKLRLIDRKTYSQIPSNQITALEYEREDGNLWVGTAGGMVRYNLLNNRIERVSLFFRTDQMINSPVDSIAVSGSDNIFAVAGNTIVRLQADDIMKEVPVDSAISGKTIDIFEVVADARGGFWAITSDGLKRWDTNLSRFKHIETLYNAHYLASIHGILWIGGEYGTGLIQYAPESGQRETYSIPGSVTAVSSDSDGIIWVGTENSGLFNINLENGSVRPCEIDSEHPYKLSSFRIRSIFSGEKNYLWIGTADTGLLSVDIGKSNHLKYIRRSGTKSLPMGSEHEIFEDSLGYIWVGSDIGGLARIDSLSGDIRQYLHNPSDLFSIMNDHINSIVEDNTGRLWIGTDSGPVLYLPEVDGFEPAGNMISGWPDFRGREVLALVQGIDGSMWISFRNGSLYHLNLLDREPSVFNFTSSSVPSVLFSDEQGTLWAGSGKNLRLFNSEGVLIKTWPATGIANGGIPEGGITNIYSDSRGRIWLGGPSGLLIYKGFQEGFESLEIPSKQIINVSGISEDSDGNIWVADGRQILIYNPAAEYVTSMGSEAGFTPSGLVSDLYHDWKGTIYAGANNELWEYRSFISSPQVIVPDVYLNELNVMNEVIESGYSLDSMGSKTLKSDEKVFSIKFEAVDYRYQGTVNYQYKLQGFSDLWVDNGTNNSVTFANLHPGEYLFSVRAVNDLGDFSQKEATLHIRIEKPKWQRTPAIILYVLVAAVLFFFLLKTWEGHLLKAQISELEETRKKVIEANKKLSFLTMNDALTGLLNRRGFDRGISHALGTAQRNSLMITLLMMDVDYFKMFNDNYGHVKGDEVLRGVGRALRQVFGRSTDIIARYGGEEFAVIFVGENPNASVSLVNDLIVAIKELGIVHDFSSVSSLLTLSVGSATIKAGEIKTVENLIMEADAALYAAKDGGRNRVCYTGVIPELPEKMKSGTEALIFEGN